MNDDKSDSSPVVSQSPVKGSARGDGKDDPSRCLRSRFSRPARSPRVIQIKATGEEDESVAEWRHLIVLLQLRGNLWFDVLISQDVFKFLVNFLLDLRMFRQVIQTPSHHYKTKKKVWWIKN